MGQPRVDRGISEPFQEIIPNKLGNAYQSLCNNTNITSGRATNMSEVSKVENVLEQEDDDNRTEKESVVLGRMNSRTTTQNHCR